MAIEKTIQMGEGPEQTFLSKRHVSVAKKVHKNMVSTTSDQRSVN
jgi:hypothetical protein